MHYDRSMTKKGKMARDAIFALDAKTFQDERAGANCRLDLLTVDSVKYAKLPSHCAIADRRK